MTILGAFVGTAIQTGAVYVPVYMWNYTLYPAIFIGIAINTLYRAVAKQVPALDQSTLGQPSYLLVLEFLIGLAPTYLFYNKFGITGLIVSFVLYLVAAVVSSFLFHI